MVATCCNRQRGSVLVMTTVGLVALLGIVGLAVDLGCFFDQKLKAQIAADAAALAAALTPYDVDLSDNLAAAKAWATANGFDMDDPDAHIAVVVHSPPANGPAQGTLPGDYYEAIITQDHPTYFLHLVGMTSFPIAARSVAGVDKAMVEGGPCVTVGDAFFSSNTDVLAKYCRFYFSGTLTTISGSIAKAYSTNQASTIFSAATIHDPGMPLPAPPGTAFPSFSGGSSVSCPKGMSGYMAVTSLTPGIYSNVHINGACSLAAGEYKISGLMSFASNAESSGEGLIFLLKAGARITTNGRMYLRSGAPGYEDFIIWAQSPPDITLAGYSNDHAWVTKTAPSLTFTHNPGSGENRLLLVSVVTGAVGPSDVEAPQVSGATFNGVTMTKVGEAAAYTDKANKVEVRTYLFQLPEANLPTGSANLVVTTKGLANSVEAPVFAGAATYNNVNQNNPLGTTATAVLTGGGGTTLTLAGITSATGEVVHGLIGVDADGTAFDLTDGGVQTRVGTFAIDRISAALSTKPGAGSLSLSWSWSGAQTAAAFAVPLKRLESKITYGENVKPLYEDIPAKRHSIYGHIYAPGVPFELGGKHNLSITNKTHLVEWVE